VKTEENGEATLPLTPETIPEVWEQALGRVGPILAAGFRRSARQRLMPPASLVIGFPANGTKDRDHCMDSSRTGRLEEVLKKLTGRAVTVRYELLPESESPPAPEEVRAPRPAQLRQAALQEPLVKGAVEKLGAQLLKADEGFGTGTAGGPATQAQ